MELIDKLGQKYNVAGIEDFETGHHNWVYVSDSLGNKIAEYEFICRIDWSGEIVSIYMYKANVTESFCRRRGITERVVLLIKDYYSCEIVFSNPYNEHVDAEDEDTPYYSDEGMAFMQRCIDKGIARTDLGNDEMEDE